MSQLDSLPWDPGGTHYITEKLQSLIYALSLAVGSLDIDEESRIYIESNANMTFAGNHAYLLADTWLMAYTNGFTTNHKTLVIPVMYASINYKYTYEGNALALVIRKYLFEHIHIFLCMVYF